MKHFAGFVRPGASVLRTVGSWASNTVAFRNPDGAEVHVLQNPYDDERTISVALSKGSVAVRLAPKSISTVIL